MPNIDASPRNADWLRVLERVSEFESWPPDRIDAECAAAYSAYAAERRRRHRGWPSSPHVDRRSVFPPGYGWLVNVVPEDAWHEYWWAAKSSQTLALALLGIAARRDPSLSWLPGAEALGPSRAGLLEVTIAPEVLNEKPRQTQLDFLAVGADGVIAVEAKFTEQGFGRCSCDGRDVGACSARVYERPYWETARRQLALRERHGSCSLSVAYQPVRNFAAARAIAGARRRSAFVLVYDAENPYFAGVGSFPGWVALLHRLAENGDDAFASLAWQELLATGVFDAEVVAWAFEKHGLSPA